MGTSIEVISALSDLNPNIAEITQLFSAFAIMPDNVLQVVIQSLDEAMIRKISRWSKAFVDYMNNLGPAAVSPAQLAASIKQDDSDDFMAVMNNTKWSGPTLSLEIVDQASNDITKAIKAQNWQDAIMTGISLAKYITPVTAAISTAITAAVPVVTAATIPNI